MPRPFGAGLADSGGPLITSISNGLVGLGPNLGSAYTLITFSTGDQIQFTGGLFNPAFVGLGGLDEGAEAANTWYYLYLIPRTDVIYVVGSDNPPFGATPGPTGYSVWYYVGAVRNDGSSNFKSLNQLNATRFDYQIGQSVGLTNVFDSSQQTLTLDAFVPLTCYAAVIDVIHNPGAASAGTWYFWVEGQEVGAATGNARAELQQLLSIGTNSTTLTIPTPNTTTKRLYHRRVSSGGATMANSIIYVSAWYDAYGGTRDN